MNESKPPSSFSVAQVVVAWIVGLTLGSGIFGQVAFHSHLWSLAFEVPGLIAGSATLASIVTYIREHWSDHE